jgi:DNA-binding response OmpR family regulator
VRVLVVEDERDLAVSLRRGLQAEGYAVDLAHDGHEGLHLARHNPYDAIILDLMLPGLNGYRVCAQLRQAEVSTPILVLTAKDGEHDEAEALDTGADDYLAKPFSYLVLVARLRALIRRGGATRPATLTVGDLSIDLARHRCRRGTIEVALTPKEFAVLACLARRPGEVLTKIDVIEEVWDMNFDGDVNIVEVYVSALRRKLDKPFDTTSIETVRGIGYRLVDGRA